MSMLNTRFKRWAQVIEKVRPGTGREAGLGHARRSSSAASDDSAWKRFGTSAESRSPAGQELGSVAYFVSRVTCFNRISLYRDRIREPDFDRHSWLP